MVDAPTGHVTLGAYMANGIEQKGIDTLQQCIKKCAAAGLGIPATVRSLSEIVGSVAFQVAIKTTRYFTTSVTVSFSVRT